jgi:hypothetical protein
LQAKQLNRAQPLGAAMRVKRLKFKP